MREIDSLSWHPEQIQDSFQPGRLGFRIVEQSALWERHIPCSTAMLESECLGKNPSLGKKSPFEGRSLTVRSEHQPGWTLKVAAHIMKSCYTYHSSICRTCSCHARLLIKSHKVLLLGQCQCHCLSATVLSARLSGGKFTCAEEERWAAFSAASNSCVLPDIVAWRRGLTAGLSSSTAVHQNVLTKNEVAIRLEALKRDSL